MNATLTRTEVERPSTPPASTRRRYIGGFLAPAAVAAATVTAIAAIVLWAVAALVPAAPKADARTTAVAEFVGADPASLRIDSWEDHETPYGRRAQAMVRDLGLVQVDAATGEVNEVIFERELGAGDGALVSEGAAIETARTFAAPRFAGFAGLTSRGARFYDHEAWREYRVTWQLRSGAAWTPTEVALGINAETGRVAYYWSARVALNAVPAARIGSDAARATAVEAAGLGRKARVGNPELRAEIIDGVQRLVWAVAVDPAPANGVRLSNHVVVHVDALTGRGEIYARG